MEASLGYISKFKTHLNCTVRLFKKKKKSERLRTERLAVGSLASVPRWVGSNLNLPHSGPVPLKCFLISVG